MKTCALQSLIFLCSIKHNLLNANLQHSHLETMNIKQHTLIFIKSFPPIYIKYLY